MTSTFIPVGLLPCPSYDRALLRGTVDQLFAACGLRFAPGEKVLVKPNLVSRANARLSCSQPEVVRAVCEHLLDCGAKPWVADSPAFGSARSVAAACGLDRSLSELGLAVRSLGHPEPLALSCGGSIGLSREARRADRIISMPRLKAHCQFRMTGAVKNLFGCVCGARKALAHMRLGHEVGFMEAMVLDVLAALPPTAALMDAIVCMHRSGPVHGEAFHLGLLGCSTDPLALDTAAAGLLGLSPADTPLWSEALRRGLPGADPARAQFVLHGPETFDAHEFCVPVVLDPMRFEPLRFMRGRLRSLLHRLG